MKLIILVSAILFCFCGSANAEFQRCVSEKWGQIFYLDLNTKEIFRRKTDLRPFLTETCGCTFFCGPEMSEEILWNIKYDILANSIHYTIKGPEPVYDRSGIWYDGLKEDEAGIYCSALSEDIFLTSCTVTKSMEEPPGK